MANQQVPGGPVVVVSPQFLVPHRDDLIITRTKHGTTSLNSGECKAKDVNGNVIFTVEAGPNLCIRPRRLIRDAAGNVILILREKLLTAHRRWEAFKCSQNDVVREDQLLFSVKRSSRLQFSYKLDVFLANNIPEHVCDFRVKEGFDDLGCTIYKGDGHTNTSLIAEMYEKQYTSKDVYFVTISDNVDWAFIVALVVLLHEIHDTSKAKSL